MGRDSYKLIGFALLLTSVLLSNVPANGETCADCQAYCRHVLSDCLSTGTPQSDCEQRYTECMQDCSSLCLQSDLRQHESKQVGKAAPTGKALDDSDNCCCLTAGQCNFTLGRNWEWTDTRSCKKVAQCCEGVSQSDCK